MVDDLVSTNSVDGINQLSVYPNPVRDVLFIINPAKVEFETVEVFDILGKRRIARSHVEDQLDLSRLSNGNYVLVISTATGKWTKQIVLK